jgi:hypothetical protein
LQQLNIPHRLASKEEEAKAISWHVMRLLKAEARCGNELAMRNPAKFIKDKSEHFAEFDSVADMIVAMHRAAVASNTLDEPIWAEWMFKRNRPLYNTAEAV